MTWPALPSRRRADAAGQAVVLAVHPVAARIVRVEAPSEHVLVEPLSASPSLPTTSTWITLAPMGTSFVSGGSSATARHTYDERVSEIDRGGRRFGDLTWRLGYVICHNRPVAGMRFLGALGRIATPRSERVLAGGAMRNKRAWSYRENPGPSRSAPSSRGHRQVSWWQASWPDPGPIDGTVQDLPSSRPRPTAAAARPGRAGSPARRAPSQRHEQRR